MVKQSCTAQYLHLRGANIPAFTLGDVPEALSDAGNGEELPPNAPPLKGDPPPNEKPDPKVLPAAGAANAPPPNVALEAF